jgi:hypothetical protein
MKTSGGIKKKVEATEVGKAAIIPKMVNSKVEEPKKRIADKFI